MHSTQPIPSKPREVNQFGSIGMCELSQYLKSYELWIFCLTPSEEARLEKASLWYNTAKGRLLLDFRCQNKLCTLYFIAKKKISLYPCLPIKNINNSSLMLVREILG